MLVQFESVTLRDFTATDINDKIRWINDPENHCYLHYDIPLEYDKTLQWFLSKNNSNRLDLVIEYENIPVGLIGLLGIDHANSKAEYYICLGEKQYKGRGIAKAASVALINYAFDELVLNKVYLNVDAKNTVACHLYEKIGFECEGYFREDLFHCGEYIDRKRYAILRTQFQR